MEGRSDSSVLTRLPTELLWIILDIVIGSPLYLATTYNGINWFEDGGSSCRYHQWVDYEASEKQRKTIGSVCKQWQIFAESKNCSFDLVHFNDDKLSTTIDQITRSRRVNIKDMEESFITSFSQNTNLEILQVPQTLWSALKDISCPQLKRLVLCLTYNERINFNPNVLLSTMGLFTHITWLEYDLDLGHRLRIPIQDNNAPILFPNLQVLICRASPIAFFLFNYLILPSLQHLSMSTWIRIEQGDISMIDIINKYRKSLRSVLLRVQCPADDGKNFPPWSNFPLLEELILESTFNLAFETIPPKHPLRRIVVQEWSFSTISSWMDAENMQHIALLDASKSTDNSLHALHSTQSLEATAMERLFTKAAKRGIQFEAGPDGDRLTPILVGIQSTE
jgi:hypothetical protein